MLLVCAGCNKSWQLRRRHTMKMQPRLVNCADMHTQTDIQSSKCNGKLCTIWRSICNTYRRPEGGPQRTLSETLSWGLYEVRTCWFALIHSDGSDISRLLIPFDLRWCTVNKRVVLSENTSLDEVRTSLICFPSGNALKLCAVISHLIPVEKKTPKHFDLLGIIFNFFFPPPLSSWTLTSVQGKTNSSGVSWLRNHFEMWSEFTKRHVLQLSSRFKILNSFPATQVPSSIM